MKLLKDFIITLSIFFMSIILSLFLIKLKVNIFIILSVVFSIGMITSVYNTKG